jgi:hypothetical protein
MAYDIPTRFDQGISEKSRQKCVEEE